MLFPSILVGQIHLSAGNELPKVAYKNDWFWDVMANEIWHYKESGWKLFTDDPCTKAEVCGPYIFLQFNIGTNEVLTAEGLWASYFVPDLRHYECFDSLMLWEGNWKTYYLDMQGTVLGWIDNYYCNYPKLDTAQGQGGFSVPQLVLDTTFQPMNCDQLKNWGFVGKGGHWLIDPIYDAPFLFENGTAEVLYYGQKRKINEKGEFVE
jgi:hypothetical protein